MLQLQVWTNLAPIQLRNLKVVNQLLEVGQRIEERIDILQQSAFCHIPCAMLCAHATALHCLDIRKHASKQNHNRNKNVCHAWWSPHHCSAFRQFPAIQGGQRLFRFCQKGLCLGQIGLRFLLLLLDFALDDFALILFHFGQACFVLDASLFLRYLLRNLVSSLLGLLGIFQQILDLALNASYFFTRTG